MPSKNKTPNLKLNNWTGNEYVKREDFSSDNVILDEAIGDLKNEVKNIDLVDNKVAVTDLKNKFTAEKLDGVLDEIDDKIIATNAKVDGLELKADKVSYNDTTTNLSATTVQGAIEKIIAEINGTTARLKVTNDSLEKDIGNPL